MRKRVLGALGGLGFTVLSALLVGCPSPPTTPDPTPTAPPPGTGATPPPGTSLPAMGKACKAAADCAAGEICDFAPGCGAAGICAAQHPCTRDLVAYCGCDGVTFHGSSSCPDRPFARRGGCEPANPPGTAKSCSSDADCANGEQCQGGEGCLAPWTCGPPRRCTRDSVEWCACDGTTFRGSGTCPTKPVRHRGKC